jgi:hypothetical protein
MRATDAIASPFPVEVGPLLLSNYTRPMIIVSRMAWVSGATMIIVSRMQKKLGFVRRFSCTMKRVEISPPMARAVRVSIVWSLNQ